MRRLTENIRLFCHSYVKGLPPATSALNRLILDHGTALLGTNTNTHQRELVVRSLGAVRAIRAIRAIRATRASSVDLPLRVFSALLRCFCSRVIQGATTGCVDPHPVVMCLPTGHSGAFFSPTAL